MTKNAAVVEKSDRRMANDTIQERTKLKETYDVLSLSKKDKAFGAIADYLRERNWKTVDVGMGQPNFLQYLDPETGISHRLDFAFIVQTERDIYQKNY